MSELFLNLSTLQPLDILLTSGDGPFSLAIKVATSIKGMQNARFSHAALLLSPSMTVEALNEEGIVCNNLTQPLGNPHAAMKPNALEYASSRLIPKWINGRLFVYVPLRGVTDALVLRHSRFKSGVDIANDLLSGRSAALDMFADIYLAQYSKFGRLSKPILELPAKIEEFIEIAISKLEKAKPDPGPFCSELVCILMGSTFGLRGDNPERVAPSELSWVPTELSPLPEALQCGPERELPGKPCGELFTQELEKILWYPSSLHQRLGAKLLEIMSYLPTIAADINQEIAAEDWMHFYNQRREQCRIEFSQDIARHLYTELDIVWKWIKGCNDCMDKCPEWKNWLSDRQNRQSTSPLTTSFLGSAFTLGRERCPNITYCTGGLCNYAFVTKNYESRFQERTDQSV
jgi:hypothetical protein